MMPGSRPRTDSRIDLAKTLSQVGDLTLQEGEDLLLASLLGSTGVGEVEVDLGVGEGVVESLTNRTSTTNMQLTRDKEGTRVSEEEEVEVVEEGEAFSPEDLSQARRRL